MLPLSTTRAKISSSSKSAKALLSSVDSTPRAYRLKASNASLTFSTRGGTSPLWCGDETFEVAPGDVTGLPRDNPHRFQNVGDTQGWLDVTVTPGGLERLFVLAAAGHDAVERFIALVPAHGLEMLYPSRPWRRHGRFGIANCCMPLLSPPASQRCVGGSLCVAECLFQRPAESPTGRRIRTGGSTSQPIPYGPAGARAQAIMSGRRSFSSWLIRSFRISFCRFRRCRAT
jgi:hypothetical protein